MVEGARLESVCTLPGTEGSNPSLSAIFLEEEGFFCWNKSLIVCFFDLFWRGVREAEGARLLSVCTLTGYRGFESLPLRHLNLRELFCWQQKSFLSFW